MNDDLDFGAAADMPTRWRWWQICLMVGAGFATVFCISIVVFVIQSQPAIVAKNIQSLEQFNRSDANPHAPAERDPEHCRGSDCPVYSYVTIPESGFQTPLHIVYKPLEYVLPAVLIVQAPAKMSLVLVTSLRYWWIWCDHPENIEHIYTYTKKNTRISIFPWHYSVSSIGEYTVASDGEARKEKTLWFDRFITDLRHRLGRKETSFEEDFGLRIWVPFYNDAEYAVARETKVH